MARQSKADKEMTRLAAKADKAGHQRKLQRQSDWNTERKTTLVMIADLAHRLEGIGATRIDFLFQREADAYRAAIAKLKSIGIEEL